MNYIITYKSSSGSTRHVHEIFMDIDSPKTYASAILLKNYLHENDEDFLMGVEIRENRIKFSRDFLTGVLEREGTLTCSYCPKTNLVIELEGMRVPQNIKATIDHIVPISKGGPVFDVKNIAVCCGKCNGKKDNLMLEDFLQRQKK